MKQLALFTLTMLLSIGLTAQTKHIRVAFIKSEAKCEKYFEISADINLETNDTTFFMVFKDLRYPALDEVGVYGFKDLYSLTNLFNLMEKAIKDTDDITYPYQKDNKISHYKCYSGETFALYSLKDGAYTQINMRQIVEIREKLNSK